MAILIKRETGEPRENPALRSGYLCLRGLSTLGVEELDSSPRQVAWDGRDAKFRALLKRQLPAAVDFVWLPIREKACGREPFVGTQLGVALRLSQWTMGTTVVGHYELLLARIPVTSVGNICKIS